ncbi:MAG: hypothetical protein ACRCXB_03725 [Aeromonadaceae bacterium]
MSGFIEIRMGAIAPKIQEQLKGCGLCEKQLEHIDADCDAITRLVIRGYITPSVAEKARGKVMKKINELKPV